MLVQSVECTPESFYSKKNRKKETHTTPLILTQYESFYLKKNRKKKTHTTPLILTQHESFNLKKKERKEKKKNAYINM
jgi:tRNA splicing endonuclease